MDHTIPNKNAPYRGTDTCVEGQHMLGLVHALRYLMDYTVSHHYPSVLLFLRKLLRLLLIVKLVQHGLVDVHQRLDQVGV